MENVSGRAVARVVIGLVLAAVVVVVVVAAVLREASGGSEDAASAPATKSTSSETETSPEVPMPSGWVEFEPMNLVPMDRERLPQVIEAGVVDCTKEAAEAERTTENLYCYIDPDGPHAQYFDFSDYDPEEPRSTSHPHLTFRPAQWEYTSEPEQIDDNPMVSTIQRLEEERCGNDDEAATIISKDNLRGLQICTDTRYPVEGIVLNWVMVEYMDATSGVRLDSRDFLDAEHAEAYFRDNGLI